MDALYGQCFAVFHEHYVETQLHRHSCGLTAIRMAIAERTKSTFGLPQGTELCRCSGLDITNVAKTGLTPPQMVKILESKGILAKSFTTKSSRETIDSVQAGYGKFPAICLVKGAAGAHWVVVAGKSRIGPKEYFCVLDPADGKVRSVQISGEKAVAPYGGSPAPGQCFTELVIRFPEGALQLKDE